MIPRPTSIGGLVGHAEWVECAFARPATVSEVEVYWFDDTGHGEVRVPASWRVLYKDGDAWKPVDGREPYGVEKEVQQSDVHSGHNWRAQARTDRSRSGRRASGNGR